ncbi:MAG: hypothetical protein AB1611_11065 [bacterium]
MNEHDKPAESLYETKDTDYPELLDAAGAAFRHTVRKIISFLQLKSGMSILDIGTGNGYDLVDLAESVSPEGKIRGLSVPKKERITVLLYLQYQLCRFDAAGRL